MAKKVIKNLDPHSNLGLLAVSYIAKKLPDSTFSTMEIMGNGLIRFCLDDADRTKWYVDIIHLVEHHKE